MRNLQALAVIGKHSNPLLIRNFAKEDRFPSLSLNYMLHTTLDIIDEKMSKSSDPYLGLLYALEDVLVYGFRTPTNLKILLVFTTSSLKESAPLKDSELRPLFNRCHQAIVRALMNPFSDLAGPRFKLLSKKLDQALESILNTEPDPVTQSSNKNNNQLSKLAPASLIFLPARTRSFTR